jgi:stearoyl-CoA desaturase (delta-9 desaturase)
MNSDSSLSRRQKTSPWSVFVLTICRWLDSDYRREDLPDPSQLPAKVSWQRTLPFIFLHLGCLAVFWVGISPVAAGAAVFLYLIRMFAITGFYHRYFSHKTFKTSRAVQFAFAALGNSIRTTRRTSIRRSSAALSGRTSDG